MSGLAGIEAGRYTVELWPGTRLRLATRWVERETLDDGFETHHKDAENLCECEGRRVCLSLCVDFRFRPVVNASVGRFKWRVGGTSGLLMMWLLNS